MCKGAGEQWRILEWSPSWSVIRTLSTIDRVLLKNRWCGGESKVEKWMLKQNENERWSHSCGGLKETKRMWRGELGRGGDGEEWKKNPFFRGQGGRDTHHLLRWNYISDAHADLMLLSHQHIAHAGMVCLCVCVCTCVYSKWGFDLFYPFLSKTPYPYRALICIIWLSVCHRVQDVRYPCPRMTVHAVKKGGKDIMSAVGG